MGKRHIVFQVVLLVFVFKLIIFGVAFLTFEFGEFCTGCYRENFIYPPEERITWKTAFKTWDANHFLYLADQGYVKGAMGNQMMPMYPFAIALLKKLTFGSGVLAGLLLSNTLSLIAFLYLFKFVEQRYDTAIAFRTLLYALVFPTSFFFTRIYSESLFFLLIIMSFYYLYKGQYLRASLIALFLPLTRAVGILMIFPFAVYIWSREYPKRSGSIRTIRKLLYAVSPALGLCVSMLLMKIITGNWFEHFEAQQLIGSAKHSLLYMFNIPKWFMENFVYAEFSLGSFRTTLFDRIAFFFYLIFLWWIYKRQDRTHFVYALLMGMVPALSDHFISYGRFLIVIFPLYIQLALTSFNHRRLQVLMFLCQCTLLGAHSLGYWVI